MRMDDEDDDEGRRSVFINYYSWNRVETGGVRLAQLDGGGVPGSEKPTRGSKNGMFQSAACARSPD